MKKTLQQQLQSRISLRRNDINGWERVYTFCKNKKDHDSARSVRAHINDLAKDQKLDRKLYEAVLYIEWYDRTWISEFE